MAGKGSNSAQLRQYNERVVLDAVRRAGECSKAEIARAANLTPQAISIIVDALVENGLLEVRGRRRDGGKGQPAQLYGLADTGAYSIGLQIGRRTLVASLVGFSGKILRTITQAYNHPTPEAVLSYAQTAVGALQDDLTSELRKRLIGIGVATPYFIGGWGDAAGFPKTLPAKWQSVDVAKLLAPLALPVIVENDGSAAGLAELVLGQGRGVKNFLYITLDRFVGGALVLDGALQTGANGNAAALGPMPVTPSRLNSQAPPDAPFEILLRRASVNALFQHLSYNGAGVDGLDELVAPPLDKLALINEWQEDCADALAQAIVGAISVVDVDAIIIDGILPSPLMADLVGYVRHRLDAVTPPGLLPVHIYRGALGAHAAAVGAALLQIYSTFSPDIGVLLNRSAEKKRKLVGML